MLSNDKLHFLQQSGDITIRRHEEKSYLGICKYTRGYSLFPYRKPFDWDYDVLRCRGLVWDFQKDCIVSQPFIKFFNVDEYPEVYVKELFQKHAYLLKTKYDGSLISSFMYEDERMYTSSGAWDSWQAQKAAQIAARGDLAEDRLYTHCYELIAPENRIVVNYGNTEKLEFLATLDKEGHTVRDSVSLNNSDIPTYESLREEQQRIKENKKDIEEGFVIYFPEINFRLKAKYKEYVEMHKLKSNLTAKHIAYNYFFGDRSLFAEFIDDDIKFVNAILKEVKETHDEYTEKIEEKYQKCLELPTRKEQAKFLHYLPTPKCVISSVFARLDDKPYEEKLRKAIVEEIHSKYPADQVNEI